MIITLSSGLRTRILETDRWETTNLAIPYDTLLGIIEQLHSRISQYICGNNREWNNLAVWIDEMEFQNAMHLIVALKRE